MVLQSAQYGNDLERSIEEMRVQFFFDSAEIIRELTLVAPDISGAPASMRSSALAAVSHIADMQERLRAQVERLSGPAIERFTIMQKVLEQQGAALRQLAILSGRYDRGAYDHRVSQDARQSRAWPMPVPAVPRLAAQFTHAPPQASSRYQTYAREAGPTGLAEDDAAVPATSDVRRGVFVPIHCFSRAILGSNFGRTLVLLGVLAAGFVVTDLISPNVSIRLDVAPRPPSAARPTDAHMVPPGSVAEPIKQAEQSSPPPAAQPRAPRVEETRASPTAAVPWPMAMPAPLPLPTSPPMSPEPLPPAPAAATPVKPEPGPALLEALPAPRGPSRVETNPAPAQSNVDVSVASPPQLRYVAVIFTHKDRARALQAFSDLRQQHPDLLKNRKSEVQAVDLGHKGVWHRVAIAPATSQQQAITMCEHLAAAGYDRCWVKPH